MSKIGDTVHAKVEKIRIHHEGLKTNPRWGWCVRPLTLLGGWLVVVVGLITIPLPGPGWVTVFVGVGILSLELEWPHRLLAWSLGKYEHFDDWWNRQSWLVRGVLLFLLLVLIWVVFALLFWVFWRTGLLHWADRWIGPWVEKLPDWVGLSRP